MRKYICDNCGCEVENDTFLIPLKYPKIQGVAGDGDHDFVVTKGNVTIGEYCEECILKIEKHIKEGVN